MLAGPALIGLASLLVAAAARGRRAAILGLILLATADQGYYGLRYAVYGHRQTWPQYLASIPVPPPEKGSDYFCLGPAQKQVSPFAPRKNAAFAERKATIRQILIRRSLARSTIKSSDPFLCAWR